MVSVDFFTVPTIRFQVLYVLLVLAHDRRRIVHFNVTAHPTAEWTVQQMREAFPFDQIPRYLLRDRDGIFGGNRCRIPPTRGCNTSSREFHDQSGDDRSHGAGGLCRATSSPVVSGARPGKSGIETIIGAIHYQDFFIAIFALDSCISSPDAWAPRKSHGAFLFHRLGIVCSQRAEPLYRRVQGQNRASVGPGSDPTPAGISS